MSKNIAESINECIDNFTPRERFNLHKIENLEPNYIKHKLTY